MIGPGERIASGTPGEGGWRDLVVIGDDPAPAVEGEVLARIVHVSDTHVCDAESPARLEYLDRFSDPGSPYRDRVGLVGTYRPQEILTVQVLAAMVEAINAQAGDIDAVIVTGDLIDNAQSNERDWCRTVLDGGRVEPWSGDPQVSQWVGSSEGLPWDERYWHPDGPASTGPDIPSRVFGYPRIPGLVEAARRAVESGGLQVPWIPVPGNHDALLQGTVYADRALRDLAVGDRRITGLPAGGSPLLLLEGVAPIGPARYVHADDSPAAPVTPDPRRRILEVDELDRPWVHDVGGVRFIAMDTVNPDGGWQGSLGSAQLRWLRQMLADSDGRYVVVLSHHPSWCLTNAHTSGEPRHLAAEVVHLLLEHPCVVGWLSGHVHAHASLWHGDDEGKGFWEITTASLIDWPQQARRLEIMRAGGRIAFRSEVIDHAAPAEWSADGIGDILGLASVSRALAANDYHDRSGGHEVREGRPQDRNAVWWLRDPYG